MFVLKHKLQNEAPADGGNEGGKDTGKAPVNESPNENFKDNPALDDNGNPIEGHIPPVEKKEEESLKDETKDTPADKPTDKPADTKFDFDAPVVKQVQALVEDAGLNAGEVAKLVTENNGEVTPALMKTLVEKHGEAVASLVAQQLGNFHTANQDKAAQRESAIFTQVESAFEGITDQKGADTWGELKGWAKDNIPNAERLEINKMLQQGGLSAKYAVDDLVSRFKSSDGFTQEASLIDGDNTAQDFGVKPMSKSDYTREFRALEAKGHVYGQSSELAALDKRRVAGQQRGI